MKIVSNPLRKIVQVESLKSLGFEPHVAWWYGGIKRSRGKDDVPVVVVFFRPLLSDNLFGDFIRDTCQSLY